MATRRKKGRRVVVVGGVAGGASAAARLRRLNESLEVVIFERGPNASFANCGLPYYVGGEIADRAKLLVAGARQLLDWLRLDVRTGAEVVDVHPDRKTVSVHEAATGKTYEESYDALLLSPGAAPLRPPALLERVGADHPRVLSLRNLVDVDRMKQAVDAGVKTAVVLGGGFIGLEVAEQLVHRGVRVVIVQLGDQVLAPVDREMATPIHEELVARGIDLRLNNSAETIEPLASDGLRVVLKNGDSLEADLVVVSIGVRPESALAERAGLAVNPRGAIIVNDHLQTSDPSIYAVGDAVEVREPIFGGRANIPLAGPANRQGRLAADHIAASLDGPRSAAKKLSFRGNLGTAIVRVFGLTAASTGFSEKALIRMGKRKHVDFDSTTVHANHHAGYYPGVKRLSLKIVFELPGGRILGAQAVGPEGVDKRIDVAATAISLRGAVEDLAQAELCYAPPFGSAKDPINLAGFQASNILRGLTRTIDATELSEAAEQGRWTILDVRTPAEHQAGHVPGALNFPLESLRSKVAEIPKDRPIATYCMVGMRGYLAERILRQHGFDDVCNLSGGYTSWKMHHADGAFRAVVN